MNELFKKLQSHQGKILAVVVITFFSFLGYELYHAPVEGFDNKLIHLIKEHGYIILFAWSILEGEMGLIMGGILSHTGDMNVYWAIFIAGLGGFVGDQIYFYVGRFNKGFIQRKLHRQRRKFAIAHLLLKKYGWPIIFVQRYMYGLRTVIPMSIGITKYSGKKFAFINLISAWAWAAITIVPAYLLGEEILKLLAWAKAHWYFALPLAGAFLYSIYYTFNRIENQMLERKNARKTPEPTS
jgi:membrane protein DedA with SNARE-associated domain